MICTVMTVELFVIDCVKGHTFDIISGMLSLTFIGVVVMVKCWWVWVTPLPLA